MKIRLDFITNSSSSSFCIFGISISPDEFPDNIIDKIYNECYSGRDDTMTKEKYKDQFKNLDNLKLRDLQMYLLKYHLIIGAIKTDDPIIFIGKSPFQMEDNQTKGGFKEEIKQELALAGFGLNENIDEICEIIEND